LPKEFTIMTTMSPELRQAVEQAGGEPVELTDPETNTAYVLVRAEAFREMKELIEDERQRSAIAKLARRNAASRMDEP
jgi:hypothetical protein